METELTALFVKVLPDASRRSEIPITSVNIEHSLEKGYATLPCPLDNFTLKNEERKFSTVEIKYEMHKAVKRVFFLKFILYLEKICTYKVATNHCDKSLSFITHYIKIQNAWQHEKAKYNN